MNTRFKFKIVQALKDFKTMHGKCVDCWVNEEGDLSTLEVDLDFEIIDGIVLKLIETNDIFIFIYHKLDLS